MTQIDQGKDMSREKRRRAMDRAILDTLVQLAASSADEIERLTAENAALKDEVHDLNVELAQMTAERDTWEKRAGASIWALTRQTLAERDALKDEARDLDVELTRARAERDALREFADDMRKILAVGIVAGPCPTPRQWAEIQCMADKLVTAIDAARKA